jgi:hypothetical protein
LAGEGKWALEVAAEVGMSVLTVRRGRRRYRDKGVDGDATRPSRVKPLSAETIAKVVDLTLHATPEGATHWSVRKMAKVVGLSPSAVQRIWACPEGSSARFGINQSAHQGRALRSGR